MSTVKVTAEGGFHNSPRFTLLVKDGKLSTWQYKRLNRHFCGIAGCVCGGVGRADIEGMNRRVFIEAVQDASYHAYPHK